MKHTRLFLILIAFSLPFIALIVSGLSIYLININEIAFTLKDIVFQLAGLFIVTSLILYLILYYFRNSTLASKIIKGTYCGNIFGSMGTKSVSSMEFWSIQRTTHSLVFMEKTNGHRWPCMARNSIFCSVPVYKAETKLSKSCGWRCLSAGYIINPDRFENISFKKHSSG